MTINYKIIQPGYFNIAVTVLMPEHVDKIAAGMVRKGYMVASALGDGVISIHHETKIGCLVVLTVYTGKKDVAPKNVSDHLIEVIKEENIFVYSSVVTEYCNAMFAGSNINVPEKPQPPALPPIPPETMRKMN